MEKETWGTSRVTREGLTGKGDIESEHLKEVGKEEAVRMSLGR